MSRKSIFKTIVAIVVALAFILPGATLSANDKKIINKNMLGTEHFISAPEIMLDDTHSEKEVEAYFKYVQKGLQRIYEDWDGNPVLEYYFDCSQDDAEFDEEIKGYLWYK